MLDDGQISTVSAMIFAMHLQYHGIRPPNELSTRPEEISLTGTENYTMDVLKSY